MELSVVSPVYNEVGNLDALYRETRDVLEEFASEWELVFVDDGSTDGSADRLRALHEGDDRVAVVTLATNFGQSAALDAGLRYASGDVIVTMDADGQNDPADMPRLVEALDRQDVDCVVGWRRERADPLGKRLSSSVARVMRRTFLGTDLHDLGCTLKAFRREATEALRLEGEMHRYIPPLLNWRGFAVGEIEVAHRERENGETKYGWSRLPKGFLDMLNVWFWQSYSSRPLHVFGGLGLLAGGIGFAGGLYSVYLKVVHAVSLSDSALPLFAVFMCLLGIQFFLSGILADIGAKNYFAVSEADTYRVSNVLEPAAREPAAGSAAETAEVLPITEVSDGARPDV
ncbi:glycosyltransferase family 2 protein [Halovivax gelatinilyticus]|uniref:glycosyltransferase family 2 protein n=1 Tax=Halovivax gelatinilyticus TaxID=2961597 RepID=UPI0020CA7529|nr:glycosyltransferase family 2 protein [Halovivax gelatinilyticus]